MIEIKDIYKSFNGNTVLDGVSVSIGKGDVVAIIGPSGTGKSTFLRCIDLLEKPERGAISLDDFQFDYVLHAKKDIIELRKRIGMVFQQFNLFKKKTALENVMEGLIVVKKKSREEAEKIAEKELSLVGLSDRSDYYPQHLSGGQQQRVAIARALAMEPELLLFDEPTSAPDPELVEEVLQTIRKIAENGNTMILVSHEMSFVYNVATKVIFLEKGRIVESGTPEQIFNAPQNLRTKEFLAKNNVRIPPEYAI
ncbi:MAG TPA: amino acid ABC transporter ATP-binding protein [Treponema sp.]|nr:amino acid ABC transporter ATP-binding protein [Treponema sp.]